MPTYKEALEINEQYALDNQKEDSGVKLLLLYFSDLDSAELLSRFNDEMPKANYYAFLNGVDKYVAQNIPVQHITKKQYFYGYEFSVNENVLIPRFETEELLANVLLFYDEYFNEKDITVLDLGTGSGCLAITLALEEKRMTVHATDISNEALEVAKDNALRLGASVTFHHGDLMEPVLDHKFDIIISNPPYIPNEEIVDTMIKDNEPNVALFGGEDGLHFYRRILKDAHKVLHNKFMIAFEHAYDKANDIKELVDTYFDDVTIIQKKDLQGKDRMTFILKT